MNFFERLGNIGMTLLENIYVNLIYFPLQRKLYDEIFSNPKPSLDEIMKNVNLVLLNSHFTMSYPRPYNPNMIEVGGLHLNRVPNPLPTDVKYILDNSPNGVIYFSMGSNIQSTTLPPEKLDALLKTFAKFNLKVLWKWEDEVFPNKPDNVVIRKWWPQEDILAHPHVKVFITHGGLLGTMESLFHSVPFIGIPMYTNIKMKIHLKLL